LEQACLDTNVLIELSRRKLVRYIEPEDNMYLPVIVFYEFLRGLAYLGRDIGRAKRELEYRFHIIWLDNSVLEKASEIYVELRRKGVLIPDPGILIAASCISHGLPLATYNREHFERIPGIKLKDPDEIISELNMYKALIKRESS